MKRLLAAAVLLCSLLALSSVATSAEAASKASKVRLKAFKSCTALVGYGNRFARKEAVPVFQSSGRPTAPPQQDSGAGTAPPQSGGPQPTSAPAAGAAPERGTDFSGTNTQEESVDEPDIVKTDGEHVFSVVGDRLHAVDVRGGGTRLAGTLQLPATAYGAELLVVGKRALVMWTASAFHAYDAGGPEARPASSTAYAPVRQETVLAEVDVADPAAMRIVRSQTVDGRLVTSRLNGRTARIVLAATPRALEVEIPPGADSEERRAAVRTAGSKRTSRWVPRRIGRRGVDGAGRSKPAVPCTSVRRPVTFSGLDTVTILTVDMTDGLTLVDSDAIMSDAETVYASENSLYVATRRYIAAVDAPFPDGSTQPPPVIRTVIHKWDIADARNTSYRGSGDVSGYLLSQFSMSEHEGVLRVASTDGPEWWPGPQGPQSESAVTTLKGSEGLLGQVGRIGGLGKGERIYAVRFIGETGYIVTFRQTDPLYTIDASDPAKPRVVGELKIPGYSAYLHPAGDGLLIGVGQDATEDGRRTGAQVSLFDVSDPANPTRLHQRSLGRFASTVAEYDHRAFLYWPATRLLMLPMSSYDEEKQTSFQGAVGMSVARDSGFTEIARVQHAGSEYAHFIRRSLVVGDRAFTLSDAGLKAHDLGTLAERGFAGFPSG